MTIFGLISLLSFFLVVSVSSIQDRSITIDEPHHFDYGLRLLYGNPDRVKKVDDSKMPFSAANAIPAILAGQIPHERIKSFLNEFNTARYVTILFSLFIAGIVFYWSYLLYGAIPAFASLTLYVFDPNIIAHSQLVTTDIYAMGTILLTFYCLWRFANHRSLGNGLLCAFVIGISCLAKYTSVVLFPLCFLALFIHDIPEIVMSTRRDMVMTIRHYIVIYFQYLLTALIIIVVVINIGFLFDRSFVHFGDYEFRSDMLKSVQQDYPVLGRIPVPVPYPYLDGLDWVMHNERTSASFGNVYLLGEVKQEGGFPGYFFIASLFKTPIAIQIILFLTFAIYLYDKNRRRHFISKELFLLVPVLFYSIYFNFFYYAQIGIRHYLVIFPLLYVFVGSLFPKWPNFSSLQKGMVWGLLMYLVISVLSYYPYYLTYFNELVWDKTQTYKYLADSNIDWGQSKIELAEYLIQNPDAVTSVERPAPVHLIININKVVGVTSSPQRYKWLRENFEPIDTLANNLLIYKISPEQIQALCENSPEYCR